MSLGDVDRSPHNKDAAFYVHQHECPECGRTYSCNCSENDRHEKLVCTDCERKG